MSPIQVNISKTKSFTAMVTEETIHRVADVRISNDLRLF